MDIDAKRPLRSPWHDRPPQAVLEELASSSDIRNIFGTSLTWQAIRGTKVVWLTVILVTLAQFSVTYIPMLQTVFATQAVPLLDGVWVIAIGVTLFALIETEKQIRLRLRALRG